MVQRRTFYGIVVGGLLFLSLVLSLSLGLDSTAAQLNPTDQQQTIEAAVNQYFTQTAAAQQQVVVTQTVGAAFNQALTATADFQATVDASFNLAITATVQASRVEWGAGQVRNIEQVIGDVRILEWRTAVIAPDGLKLIWLTLGGRPSLCIYSFDEHRTSCYESPARSIGWESLTWSPDSQ